jgi:hypothetical protein
MFITKSIFPFYILVLIICTKGFLESSIKFNTNSISPKTRSISKDTNKTGIQNTFIIDNATEWDLTFFTSTDSITWNKEFINSGFRKTLNFYKKELYIKIYTRRRFNIRRISSSNKYKIIASLDSYKFDIEPY